MYKVGDKVRIKSRGWYQANKDYVGNVCFENETFTPNMCMYLGNEAIIIKCIDGKYQIDIDNGEWLWTDEMFYLVETKALWYAVDRYGFGKLFKDKPERQITEWDVKNCDYALINPKHLSAFFPSLTWEDEPIQIEIKKL